MAFQVTQAPDGPGFYVTGRSGEGDYDIRFQLDSRWDALDLAKILNRECWIDVTLRKEETCSTQE